ncbi:hypothetical protein RclHR1_06340005 [Rhizophagus clarus]|uniref:Uncharacterized protein n=1 Tax=Rhizophagus clarus TaxID=94130 RepID=A0A2Z6SIK5_9GLOM|nr:hypothetical protein RclHR1_06340005 [Rhizophagus clarus]
MEDATPFDKNPLDSKNNEGNLYLVHFIKTGRVLFVKIYISHACQFFILLPILLHQVAPFYAPLVENNSKIRRLNSTH